MRMEKASDANELKIVFIYDRLICRREEDDPKDAILYFHPESISIEKRIAICGQLMGVTHFFNDSFTIPRIMSMANGKFALRSFDEQYVLALGSSSVTSDWLLEKEADILESVIKFFHCDIQRVLLHARNDRNLVSLKLTAMMDHYIPISQHHGDLFSLTFGILPILSLPKSANNVSLQASVLLQTCMLKTGVLGGIVMYQNKVVGVELGQSLAQKLAFIQPYRMPPADLIELDFKLPIGVQIFRVYITESELRDLHFDCSKFQEPETIHQNIDARLNFNKRDSTKIMRNRIEEECDPILGIAENQNKVVSTDNLSDVSSGIHSEENGEEFSASSLIPAESNFSKNQTNLTFDEIVSSTKMKPRRCQSVVDIFQDSQNEVSEERSLSPPINGQHLERKFRTSLADPTFPYFRANGRHSVSSSFHYSQSTESDDEDDDGSSPKPISPTQATIITSTPISDSINLIPTSKQRPIDLPLLKPNKISGKQLIKNKVWSTFNDLLSPNDTVESSIGDLVVNDHHSSAVNENGKKFENGTMNSGLVSKIPDSIHLRLLSSFRRLSNQEDPIGEGRDGDAESACSYSTTSSEVENQSRSSISSTSRPTRLISPPKTLKPQKHIPSRSCQLDLRKQKSSKENKSSFTVKPNSGKENACHEVGLYIYYDGSMRLLLLLDPKMENNRELIDTLWEYVSSSLIQLKISVSNVEEQSTFSHQSDPYCFLRYESIWRSLAHGGRNESMDFNTVQVMHRDFTRHPNINELIIRGDDHVVYGYQCVGSEIYYQQRAGLQPGLPMPSDLMGKVPLKAKRRLERDHSIILL